MTIFRDEARFGLLGMGQQEQRKMVCFEALELYFFLFLRRTSMLKRPKKLKIFGWS